MRPDQEWTQSGLTVHRNEWLFITATGEVLWSERKKSLGPDGVHGVPGWPVGAEGLLGRIDGASKPFSIGARTAPFHYRNAKSRGTYPPQPIHVPSDGRLLLGFKDFKPGANTGEVVVTIRRPR